MEGLGASEKEATCNVFIKVYCFMNGRHVQRIVSGLNIGKLDPSFEEVAIFHIQE